MKQRTLFIGDVHGCYDELMLLCERMNLIDTDHLYFVGDLINKGPKSLEVVEWIRSRPNTWSVIGNHEFFLLPENPPLLTGGNQSWVTIEHDKTESLRKTMVPHKEWLLHLPHMIERENFILVHGGLHPEYGIDTPVEIATIIRMYGENPWYEYYNGTKLIIYGHWAVEGLRVRANTIGLDTGCSFGGHLTAYCLETGEFWQSRANAVYKEPGHWKI